jgi:hypothetical protein
MIRPGVALATVTLFSSVALTSAGATPTPRPDVGRLASLGDITGTIKDVTTGAKLAGVCVTANDTTPLGGPPGTYDETVTRSKAGVHIFPDLVAGYWHEVNVDPTCGGTVTTNGAIPSHGTGFGLSPNETKVYNVKLQKS